MTSYGGKELASAFRTVRKNTIQVAEDIPESKYGFVAAPEVRSVGRMLTHIAIGPRIFQEVHKKGLTTLVGSTFSERLIGSTPKKPRTGPRPRSSNCCERRESSSRRGW